MLSQITSLFQRLQWSLYIKQYLICTHISSIHLANYNRERGCPSTLIKKKCIIYIKYFFYLENRTHQLNDPLIFCRLPFCFFAHWRWTNSYLFWPFWYIYIYNYIRKNITAHCTPPFAHTFHTVSISLLVNMVSKHIKWYDTDKPFRIPHFPLLFENVMLCKTITYYDQAAIVFQYVFFLVLPLYQRQSVLFFYQELSRFIRQLHRTYVRVKKTHSIWEFIFDLLK